MPQGMRIGCNSKQPKIKKYSFFLCMDKTIKLVHVFIHSYTNTLRNVYNVRVLLSKWAIINFIYAVIKNYVCTKNKAKKKKKTDTHKNSYASVHSIHIHVCK